MPISPRASSKASAGSGTAISVTAPTGVSVGDLVLCFVHGNGQTTIVDNNGATPFTEDLNDYQPNAVSGHTLSVFSRRIVAGDPASYAFTLGATGRWSVIALALKNPNQSVIYNVPILTSNHSDQDSNSVVCTGITTTKPNALHIVAAAADNAAAVIAATAGYTSHEITDQQPLAVCSKPILIPSFTGDKSFAVTGAVVAWSGVSMAIASPQELTPTQRKQFFLA